MRGHQKIPRYAKVNDVDNIYTLCCKVGLNSDIDRARKKGFLITDYENHPEIKKSFEYDIDAKKNPFYVFERDGSVAGVLIGRSKEQWMSEEAVKSFWNGVSWDAATLAEIGIEDINDCDFAVLEKIASDPDIRKSGISSKLLETYFESQRDSGIQYILSLVVADVYNGDKTLGIENSASKGFHEKIGARKIGTSSICQEPKTFLGENGKFKYSVYMLPLNKY